MDMKGDRPLNDCSGWTQVVGGCRLGSSFADDDIYFLEVCLFNQICRNRDELFNVESGDDFECDFTVEGFRELQRLLLLGRNREREWLGL